MKKSFSTLISFIPVENELHFASFKLIAAPFLGIEEEDHLKEMRRHLAGKPPRDWHMYLAAINSYNQFGEGAF